MKKIGIWVVGAAFTLSSCNTYTGQGAYAGGTIGAILGSAIGGVSGGWRGSDLGTIIGMAGGAAVGAAIGAQADQQRKEEIEGYHRRMQQRQRQYDDYDGGYDQNGYDQQGNDSGYDGTNQGDDRIDLDMPGPKGEPRKAKYEVINGEQRPKIEIRRVKVMDGDRDGILHSGEQCTVSFEIMNRTNRPLYDVQPVVYDVTGNRHIHISPNLHVERIDPNSGVRYTASILADKKLKDGEARIRVGALVGNEEQTKQEQEITLITKKQ
ncbi:MAG: hypothetical protein IJV17_01895 [Prevotella sp.]|nr:hypothetical protein [Prevotella sp.]